MTAHTPATLPENVGVRLQTLEAAQAPFRRDDCPFLDEGSKALERARASVGDRTWFVAMFHVERENPGNRPFLLLWDCIERPTQRRRVLEGLKHARLLARVSEVKSFVPVLVSRCLPYDEKCSLIPQEVDRQLGKLQQLVEGCVAQAEKGAADVTRRLEPVKHDSDEAELLWNRTRQVQESMVSALQSAARNPVYECRTVTPQGPTMLKAGKLASLAECQRGRESELEKAWIGFEVAKSRAAEELARMSAQNSDGNAQPASTASDVPAAGGDAAETKSGAPSAEAGVAETKSDAPPAEAGVAETKSDAPPAEAGVAETKSDAPATEADEQPLFEAGSVGGAVWHLGTEGWGALLVVVFDEEADPEPAVVFWDVCTESDAEQRKDVLYYQLQECFDVVWIRFQSVLDFKRLREDLGKSRVSAFNRKVDALRPFGSRPDAAAQLANSVVLRSKDSILSTDQVRQTLHAQEVERPRLQ